MDVAHGQRSDDQMRRGLAPLVDSAEDLRRRIDVAASPQALQCLDQVIFEARTLLANDGGRSETEVIASEVD